MQKNGQKKVVHTWRLEVFAFVKKLFHPFAEYCQTPRYRVAEIYCPGLAVHSLVYTNHNCKLSGASPFFILLYSSDAADLKRAAASLDYNRRN